MKKILLFSRDPGGANTILPLVPKLKTKYEVILLGKDAALKKYEQNHLEASDIMEECKEISMENIERVIKKYRPDFIITGTSADDNTEKYFWKAGEKFKIPSFAILDQWMNYGIRFSEYGVSQLKQYEKEKRHLFLPTRILAMDEYAKCKLKEEGLDERRILVSGQPYFEWFSSQLEAIGKEEVEKYKNILKNENEQILVFASEPICKTYGENSLYWGYTEKTIFQSFHEVLNKVTQRYEKKVKVLIRPHPKEGKEEWKEKIENTEYITYVIDTELDGKMAIKLADLICGMSSMFLIEAAICQKSIMSIQIGLSKENPFILDKMNVLKSILSKEELERKMKNFFIGLKSDCRWEIEKGATDKVIELMEELI